MHFVGELIIFGGILIGGFASLAAAWRQYRQTRKTDHPRWRVALATFGLFAASLQALLLAAFWLYNNVGGDSYSMFQNWARTEIILFVVAPFSLLVGIGKYRWWALLSSCLIFAICFFTVLSV